MANRRFKVKNIVVSADFADFLRAQRKNFSNSIGLPITSDAQFTFIIKNWDLIRVKKAKKKVKYA